MDVAALHAVTEDLAGYLSEAGPELGDLHPRLLDENREIADALGAPARPRPAGTLDLHGGGLERAYRETARAAEDAFAATADPWTTPAGTGRWAGVRVADLYEMHLGNTVLRTWDVSRALGLGYRPGPALVHRVLRTMLTLPVVARREGGGFTDAIEVADAFDHVLVLSGRGC